MCRSSRSAASPRCSPRRCRTSPRGSARRRCRWRWPGCFTASPNILLIPGTSSLEHLRENLAAGELALPGEVLAELNRTGEAAQPPAQS